MRVAVDMDDVVVSFFPFIYECVNREFGTDLDVADCHDWDDNDLKRLDVFGPGKTWWDWLQSRAWLWTTCPAVPGAIGGLQTLRDRGHRVELLTSKPEWAEWVTWAWLGKWRPAVTEVSITRAGETKADRSSADILVDDAPHNLYTWEESDRAVICFDRPWNQWFGGPRARTWADVIRLVDLYR